MNAQAIVFEKPREVAVREIELPELSQSDVLVETEFTGVSVGTERWALTGQRPEIRFPNIPGYMAVGRIQKVGKKAASLGYKVGDRLSHAKGKPSPAFQGRSWMGSHVSHAVLDVCTDAHAAANPIRRLPVDLEPIDAVLLALCGVAMQGIELATIRAGARVLIAGVGVVGMYALQVCRLKGAAVTVSDVATSRLDIARKLGAQNVVNPNRGDLVEMAKSIAPGGFDVVIDTSSIPAVVNGVTPLLKPRGTFVFQGYYPGLSGIDVSRLALREATAVFPDGFLGDRIAIAMDWANEGRLDSRSLITNRARPQDAAEVYQMILAGSDESLGVVFDWRGKRDSAARAEN